MAEKVVIIGSGPAGWAAAIYAARANLVPSLSHLAPAPENPSQGTAPVGPLHPTTEAANLPGWPAADNGASALYARSALPQERYYNRAHYYEGKAAHRGKRAVEGPELME